MAYGEFQADSATLLLWHCETVTNGTTPDSSSNGNTGTLIWSGGNQNNLTQIETGKFGRGFSGTAGLIRTASALLSTSDGAQPYTLEGWFKIPSTTTGSDGILTQYKPNDANRVGLRLDGTNKLAWWRAGTNLAVGVTPINTGAWVYLAATRDASGVVRLYVNGNQDATCTDAGVFSNYPFAVAGVVTTTINDGGAWLRGAFDEIRVSNVARSAAEIRAYFQQAAGGFAAIL